MDGIVVQMCKSGTISESIVAHVCHVFANGQIACKTVAISESPFSYFRHGIRDGQRAC